jgi:aminomethyltransferase
MNGSGTPARGGGAGPDIILSRSKRINMIEISSHPSMAAQYEQAHSSCLVVRHPAPGLLVVGGDHRLDFLNRMSTNQILGLAPGSETLTVFTSAIGRIVEAARVLTWPDQAWLLTAPGRAGALREWLARYIFFRDRVTLAEPTGPWAHYGLYGPGSAALVRALAPGLPIPVPGMHSALADGVVWSAEKPRPGLEVLLPEQTAARAEAAWPIAPDAQDTYEALRIEAGQPEVGREITSEVIPLEVGLWEAVSFSKGCYIGQEIIARMESRGRLARRLLGVRLERRAEPGSEVRQAEAVQGSLTSVAESPRLGWIGLAVVRPAALSQNGGQVRVGREGVPGQLVELPFGPSP